MPTRKQRRRREKLKRHEWEEVYVDEEGRELAPEEVEELAPATRRASTSASERKGQQRQAQARTPRRPVEPPSVQRTLRRGLIFFPLMLITVFLLAGDEATTAGKITQTIVLMAFFLPFSYFMDRFMWRAYQRRLARESQAKKA